MSGTQAVFDVVSPGLQTLVQDHPGRRGLQSKGFFPAGPVDPVSFRIANALVGNAADAAALEIPMGRLTVRVLADTAIAVTGASGAEPTLNGTPVPLWQTVPVRAGDEVVCPTVKGPGFRLYLAVAGGVDVPLVLGSRATYTMGGIGGVEGRALAKGDVLRAHRVAAPAPLRVPDALRPVMTNTWEIEVMRGPHADPDFLTEADWRDLVGREWKVDLNSNRVGTRLNAHRFTWSRSSGGVAGGHPSNILDGSYPIGGVNTNGDVPVILGPDGPTAGGFTVVATVVQAGLWKVGQLRPGRDTIRFREVDLDEALALAERLDYTTDARHYEEL
ncbi:biotin-dependent carboxyltransferase family protein [Streptomyces sp. NPDC127068]|uniref:5-oxoprolinase subunit C family protein n=1 Tax=Streptomyces sp. NPDC127068 TaxID=3347127 RepID=UPI00365122D5